MSFYGGEDLSLGVPPFLRGEGVLTKGDEMVLVPDRTAILEEAQRLVHGNRGADYGHPLDDYTRTAGMVSAMLAHILKRPIQADEMIQIMICVKLSRQVNKPKRDNTVDGAGYFECLQMAIDEFNRRNQGDPKSE